MNARFRPVFDAVSGFVARSAASKLSAVFWQRR
jgi:hypothetical protein